MELAGRVFPSFLPEIRWVCSHSLIVAELWGRKKPIQTRFWRKKWWEMASRNAPLWTGNNCSSDNQGLWQSCWWGLRSRLVHRNRIYISWLLKVTSFTCFDTLLLLSSHLRFSHYLLQNLNNIKKNKIKPKGALQFHFLKNEQEWLITCWLTKLRKIKTKWHRDDLWKTCSLKSFGN